MDAVAGDEGAVGGAEVVDGGAVTLQFDAAVLAEISGTGKMTVLDGWRPTVTPCGPIRMRRG